MNILIKVIMYICAFSIFLALLRSVYRISVSTGDKKFEKLKKYFSAKIDDQNLIIEKLKDGLNFYKSELECKEIELNEANNLLRNKEREAQDTSKEYYALKAQFELINTIFQKTITENTPFYYSSDISDLVEIGSQKDNPKFPH